VNFLSDLLLPLPKARYQKIIQPKRQDQNVIHSVRTRSKDYPICEKLIQSLKDVSNGYLNSKSKIKG